MTKPAKFSVLRLLMKHHTVHSEEITAKLGIEPSWSYSAGSERTTPKGTKLPGQNRLTVWSYSIEELDVDAVPNEIEIMSERIALRRQFIADLVQSGGYACLIVDLPGSMNTGVVVSPHALKNLSDASVSFGFEVFPDM